MIFVDSNIPMYLIGAEHPHKVTARRLLEQAVLDRKRLVTDAEVLQEILHRYVAIQRPDAIQPAFDVLRSVVDEVFSVSVDIMDQAKDLVLRHDAKISARDALHVALMQIQGIETIMSFDRDFDRFAGIQRLC